MMSPETIRKLPAEVISSSLLTARFFPRLFLNALQTPVALLDANPVIIIPGLFAGDWSTLLLQKHLRNHGYRVYKSGITQNQGNFLIHLEVLQRQIKRASDRTGRPVDLIGWSMGGRFAFRLAMTNQHEVAKIITLGSPLHKPDINAFLEYFWRAALISQGMSETALRQEMETDCPLPTEDKAITAVVADYDAVVDSQSSRLTDLELIGGKMRENIDILRIGHIGLGQSATVNSVILDRLSQRRTSWQPHVAA